MTTVYLAGPMAGLADEDCIAWRDEATEYLAKEGIDTLNPMVRDYRHVTEFSEELLEEIVEGDKADIDNSDLVLANCPFPSVGTSMEILYAWMYGTVVVTIATNPSPWVLYHSTIVVDSLENGLAAVIFLKQLLQME